MTGNEEDVYIVKETPMMHYLNVHTALEQMRKKAEDEGSCGPRVSLDLYRIVFHLYLSDFFVLLYFNFE